MRYYPNRNKRGLSIGKDGNALTMLIAINLVVFVIFKIIRLMYPWGDAGTIQYNAEIINWFALPAEGSSILSKPWTIITHMFLHERVWHILGNMIWLWCFGFIMQDLTGNKQIIPVYIYGGLAGALAFILAYNFLGELKPALPVATALGASAGVMGIAAAITLIAPQYRIFPMINGGIPLWVLTVIFVIIDLATIPDSNPGGHIAHLAGAAMGCGYVVLLRRGTDIGAWMNNLFTWVNDLWNPDKAMKAKKMKEQLFYKSQSKPFRKTSNLTQQKIDEILDKISQKGYHHLTDEEKELLKRASKEDI